MYVVPPYADRYRLDAFLTRVVGTHSRSEWQKLIGLGLVTSRGNPQRASQRVESGQEICVDPPPERLEPLAEADIPFDVMFEDPAMAVVDKPAGVVVHPAPGHEQGTLVNALLSRFPEPADPTGQQRPGIVHRLDKDTSGLLVIGKTAAAVAGLQEQFKGSQAEKHYTLLVHGRIVEDEGLIDAPIGRDLHNRQKMSVRADGKPAQTRFQVLRRIDDFSLVDATLLTGRTHQLRVHFAFIGHPVAGDTVYGRRRFPPGLKRQFVHSRELEITSPHDGVRRRFTAPLPTDLEKVLDQLERTESSRHPGAGLVDPNHDGGES